MNERRSPLRIQVKSMTTYTHAILANVMKSLIQENGAWDFYNKKEQFCTDDKTQELYQIIAALCNASVDSSKYSNHQIIEDLEKLILGITSFDPQKYYQTYFADPANLNELKKQPPAIIKRAFADRCRLETMMRQLIIIKTEFENLTTYPKDITEKTAKLIKDKIFKKIMDMVPPSTEIESFMGDANQFKVRELDQIYEKLATSKKELSILKNKSEAQEQLIKNAKDQAL